MTTQLINSRFAELKQIVKQHEPVVYAWVEALREIRDNRYYLEEADTFDEWCQENVGRTAKAIHNLLQREAIKSANRLLAQTAKSCPEDRDKVMRPLAKAEKLLSSVTAKLDRQSPPPAMHPPQVTNDKTATPIITADIRISIHRVTQELDKLLRNSSFALSETFRHCVAELKQVDHLLQPFLPGMELPAERQRSRGTLQEVEEFIVNRGLTARDAEWFFSKCEGCGWKNNGKAIVDWRQTVRAWQALGTVFPSQREKNNSKTGTLSASEMIVRQKELESAIAQITALRNSYSEHQAWSPKDKEKFQRLRARRDELKTMLGVKV